MDVTGATTMASTMAVTDAATLNSTLDVTDVATFNATLHAISDVSFDSTLRVDGATTLNNATTITGPTSINNKLAVAQDASFNKILQVAENAIFDKKIIVDGDASLNSESSIAKRMFVNEIEIGHGGGDLSQNITIATFDHFRRPYGSTNTSCRYVSVSDPEIIYTIYCKDATNTGYRIRPGPSKIKPRFNPSLTPESA